MTTSTPSERAAAHFGAKLEFETDPSDTHAALARGAELVVVDVRSAAAWRQGRVRGAVHLPGADIGARAHDVLDRSRPVVVYCWGPGCNGATKAALALAGLGFSVREMIGGFEYWAREGLPVDTDRGVGTRAPDPLTVPLSTATCDC
jgi:rhodanese-related sulfurtransferase